MAVLSDINDLIQIMIAFGPGAKLVTSRQQQKIAAEVIDLRVLNPVRWEGVVSSVEKTGHLLAIDGGWTNCGMAAEIIAAVSERINWKKLKAAPARVTLTDSPAPTSGALEDIYYTKTQNIVDQALCRLGGQP